MNECYPLYGIVICGCCQAKFGFGFGMSEYVKCPKCSSVNKVPLEPKKQYQSASILSSENMGGYPMEPERARGPRGREHEEEEYFQAGSRY
jgi:phage FluMu protein Com